ncbi:MAG: hypothetical protein V1850_07300 [Candidatus Bathyarchaeota archaeon]
MTDELLNQTLERLKKLEEVVKQIQKRFEELQIKPTSPKERISQLSTQAIIEIDSMNLPDSLRKTMMIIIKLRETTPEEVAKETNRTRGLENIYLNQLERIGYVEKVKKGKRVYFRSLRAV